MTNKFLIHIFYIIYLYFVLLAFIFTWWIRYYFNPKTGVMSGGDLRLRWNQSNTNSLQNQHFFLKTPKMNAKHYV